MLLLLLISCTVRDNNNFTGRHVAVVCMWFVQDFAAEVVTIKGTQTEEDELVVIRNVDVLAKW